jgi:site-specific DNA-methyltransferase (adenine-specific)
MEALDKRVNRVLAHKPNAQEEKKEDRHFANTPPNKLTYLGGDIYEGDCLEVMKRLDDKSVDMILCDLPYGTTQNKWDSLIPLDELWQEYRRIIKPKGVIALTSQGIFTARLILSNEAWFRYKFVWVKSKPTNFLNARRQPLRQHEDICIFYESQPNYRPVMSKGEPYDKGIRKAQYTGSYGDFRPVQVKSDGDRFPTDTLYCKTAESEPGGRVWHPTQKPVALGRYLIRMFTVEGDVVLDNAFGSGSFLVAAALEGRRFIGIEKNKEVHLFKGKRIDYIEVAKLRLSEVEAAIKSKQHPPPLFSALQPAARAGEPNRRGMVDVDAVIQESHGECV